LIQSLERPLPDARMMFSLARPRGEGIDRLVYL